jgi:hypothetical protein
MQILKRLKAPLKIEIHVRNFKVAIYQNLKSVGNFAAICNLVNMCDSHTNILEP